MKVIKPSVSYLDKKGMTPYQFIEKIGRTCYKSEDKITEDSSSSFVKGLVNRKHYAMIEHYWVHLVVRSDIPYALTELGLNDVKKYMHFTILEDGVTYVSCPLRVFFDHIDIMEDLHNRYIEPVQDMWQCVINRFYTIFELFGYPIKPVTLITYSTLIEEEDFCNYLVRELELLEVNSTQIAKEVMKHRTHTLHFVCDRGVSHELVRHRPCSFAQESTRYCNYSKGKFGDEITVIEPYFFKNNIEAYTVWKNICEDCEKVYMNLLNSGATPQEARSVLPNSLKTEIIITANEEEWQHILNLRYHGTTGTPHPQMLEIMSTAHRLLLKESEGRLR